MVLYEGGGGRKGIKTDFTAEGKGFRACIIVHCKVTSLRPVSLSPHCLFLAKKVGIRKKLDKLAVFLEGASLRYCSSFDRVLNKRPPIRDGLYGKRERLLKQPFSADFPPKRPI